MKRLLFGALFLPLLGSVTYIPAKSSGSFSGGTVTGATTFSSTITTGACIELGNASDTSVCRSASGAVSIEGMPLNDPVAGQWWFDDFINGNAANAQIGQHGFSFNAIATGTLAANSAAFRTGGLVLNSHASNDNSGDVISLGNVNMWRSVSGSTIMSGTNWELDAVIDPGSSGAVTNTGMFFGWAASTTVDPMTTTGLVGIRRDTDKSDTTWTFVTCDSSTSGCASNGDDTNQKVVASTKTPVAGTNTRLRLRRAASGVGGLPTIYMRVDDETEKTFCASGCDDDDTQVPAGTVAMVPIFSYLTRTTTGVQSGDIDYFSIKVPNLQARY